jgi:hypothetical protein
MNIHNIVDFAILNELLKQNKSNNDTHSNVEWYKDPCLWLIMFPIMFIIVPIYLFFESKEFRKGFCIFYLIVLLLGICVGLPIMNKNNNDKREIRENNLYHYDINITSNPSNVYQYKLDFGLVLQEYGYNMSYLYNITYKLSYNSSIRIINEIAFGKNISVKFRNDYTIMSECLPSEQIFIDCKEEFVFTGLYRVMYIHLNTPDPRFHQLINCNISIQSLNITHENYCFNQIYGEL